MTSGPRSYRFVAAVVPATLATLLAAQAAPPPAAAPASASAAAPAGGIPPVSSLPRLRPLWTAPRLMEIHSASAGTPIRGGLVLAWAYDAPQALVALDLHTGKPRWRMPMPNEARPDIVLAGNLVLVYRSIGATAVELATGQQRWTKRLCRFSADLQALSGPHVGVGTCTAAPPPRDESAVGSRLIWTTYVAVAIDLDSGRELWRVPTGQTSGPIAAAGGAIHVVGDADQFQHKAVKVSTLDPRTGKALRSFVLPHVPSRMYVDPGDPTRGLFVGADVVAANLADGRVLWTVATTPPSSMLGRPARWPELRAGRFVAGAGNHLSELDLRTGAVVATWDVPEAAGRRPQLTWAIHGGALVIKDRDREPALALRFGRPGDAPQLAALPVTFDGVIGVEDDVLIVRDAHDLAGYAALDTIASEATGMDAPARVRAILARQSWRWGRRYGEKKEQAAGLAELRSVAGFEAALTDVARDVTSPVHDAAVDAVALTRVPAAAEILLAEITRPMGFPPSNADPRAAGHDRLNFNNPMLRRSDLATSLADLDDAKAADVLTPLLFTDESPTGLGRRDWEAWGGWVESGYGKKSWAATHSDPSAAFSVCLQAPSGRPEAHAAIYRMLARLGRPRDITALQRFDAANGAAGGWAHVCDADDALTEPFVDAYAARSNGLGLCKGWDVTGYRVTQSEAIWLRKRLPNGALGPPAWAFNPLGDTLLHRRQLRGTRLLADGKIEVRIGDDVATLSPTDVFADRDHDGLTDATETALGTDPDRADADGDGIPDGRDPAPLAPASNSDTARIADEIVRFVTTFRMGGPVSVYADRALWGGGGGIASVGVALHRPPAGPAVPCDRWAFCEGSYVWGAHAWSRRRENLPPGPATEGSRHCEMIFSIASIAVAGAKAHAVVLWPAQNGNGQRVEHKLDLRKLAGTWRVTDDRGPMF